MAKKDVIEDLNNVSGGFSVADSQKKYSFIRGQHISNGETFYTVLDDYNDVGYNDLIKVNVILKKFGKDKEIGTFLLPVYKVLED